MDACFAGAVKAVVQRENKRSYEYLGACAAEKVTASPGGKSFTTALMQSLEQLLENSPRQSFTTTDLHRTIKGKRFMTVSEPCLLCRSAYDDRRIRLAPLKKTERYFDTTWIAKYLNLRIELKQETLTSEEVEDLAKRVSGAVRNSIAKTRRVDFVRLESPKPKISWFGNPVMFARTKDDSLYRLSSHVEWDTMLRCQVVMSRYLFILRISGDCDKSHRSLRSGENTEASEVEKTQKPPKWREHSLLSGGNATNAIAITHILYRFCYSAWIQKGDA
ncbi:hypothetical protein EJ08DRAFT_44677 [Tothia fuscella]|uniref:Uncharacterized protein n=1 Tax=Tothia fuscella TaxID=1048955 RepID=A0A9P4NFY4_9PEZI|nr:hypothetical protein EJ08DRAFT_44677 [Tothia fuscella]